MTNDVSNTQMQDREAVTQARAVIGNRLIDPDLATKVLLEHAERGLSNRAELLGQRFKAIHFRLSLHTNRSIAAKDAVIDPRFNELSDLRVRGEELGQELDMLLNTRDHPSTSTKQRRLIVQTAKRKLAEMESIKRKMEMALAPVTDSLRKMEEELQIAAPLWAGIQGAERLATKLHFSLGLTRIWTSLLRLVFFSIAFTIAFVIDRYTPVTESIFVAMPAAERHDTAIFVLFVLQAQIFEPTFSRLKKALSWRVHNRLTRQSEELLARIESYEAQMLKSEQALTELEGHVS